MTPNTDLIERLRACDWKKGGDVRLQMADELAVQIFGAKATLIDADMFLKALHGSIDAATTIIEQALPDYHWIVNDEGNADIWSPEFSDGSPDVLAQEKHPRRSVALLIALLQALDVGGSDRE